MVRSRSRPQRNVRTYAVEVDLTMECDDDELSPVQKSVYKKAAQEYLAFKKQLEQYKAQNAVIEYLHRPMSEAEIAEVEGNPRVTVEESYHAGWYALYLMNFCLMNISVHSSNWNFSKDENYMDVFVLQVPLGFQGKILSALFF